jgi:hypothetical protein
LPAIDSAVAQETGREIVGAAIERREKLSTADFAERYSSGVYRPVIVTDAMSGWRARTEWSFDFFRRRYGSEQVIVTDRLLRPDVAKKVNFGDYLEYSENPQGSALSRIATGRPLYLTHFSPFAGHPELLADFTQPYFIQNAYAELTGRLRDWYFDNFSWVFIGPKGTISPLHADLFGTHAWLAQITGRKRVTLFSPSDAPFLYDGQFDPLNYDPAQFPLLEKTKPIVTILEPGEVIFIPAGWVHHVISLDPSISLTFNFANTSNLALHVLSISRDLPSWVKKMESAVGRDAFRFNWVSKGFEFPAPPA